VQISVLRGSTATRVSTHDLVVGDIVMLSTGYKEKNLKIQLDSLNDPIECVLYETGDILPADGVVIGLNDPIECVLYETGDILPADGVVIGLNDLAINEKMLTGANYYVLWGGCGWVS
jgi:magnesium-transporting ATPase (P-type)